MPRSIVWWLLAAIAVGTIVTGAVQIIRPAFVLEMIGGETTPGARHFFGIVGMFMALFGGVLLHALLAETPQPIVVLWAGLQKLGAAVAVTLGVQQDLFTSLALGVAGFDLFSGLLALLYWRALSESLAA